MKQLGELQLDDLEPAEAWFDGEEKDARISVEIPDFAEEKVALHIQHGGQDENVAGARASVYLTSTEALILAERLAISARILNA